MAPRSHSARYRPPRPISFPVVAFVGALVLGGLAIAVWLTRDHDPAPEPVRTETSAQVLSRVLSSDAPGTAVLTVRTPDGASTEARRLSWQAPSTFEVAEGDGRIDRRIGAIAFVQGRDGSWTRWERPLRGDPPPSLAAQAAQLLVLTDVRTALDGPAATVSHQDDWYVLTTPDMAPVRFRVTGDRVVEISTLAATPDADLRLTASLTYEPVTLTAPEARPGATVTVPARN